MAKRATTKAPKPAQAEPSTLGPMAITVSEAATSNIARLYNPTDYEAVARGLMGTVYAAAAFKATVFAGVPLRLFRRVKGGPKAKWNTRPVKGRRKAFLAGHLEQQPTLKAMTYGADDDIEEVLDHPAIRLLQDPEPGSTGSQWFWTVHMLRQLTARAFLWDGGQYQPDALYCLRNPFVTIKYSRSVLIDGYWYGRDSTSKQFLPANEVIYTRSRPSLSSHVESQPWPASVAGLSQLEVAAIQSELARWNNGGQPGMVVQTKVPFTDDVQLRKAKHGLSEQIRSVNKHGDIMLLSAMELVQYSAKPHEMNYAAGLELSEQRIYRAAGIPEPIWKMAASNKASAVAADPAFASMTVLPELGVFADELTEMLLPRFGVEAGEMWFAFDNPVREDQALAVTQAVSLYTAGLVRRNVALGIAGQEPVEDQENVYAGQPVAAMVSGDSGPDASGDIRVEQAGPDQAAIDKLQSLVQQVAAGTMPINSARALAAMTAPGVDVSALFSPLEKDDAAAVDVQDTALNGAQIAELTSLVAQVAAGEIPLESARAVADAAYPLVPPEKIDAVFNPLRTFKPREESNEKADKENGAGANETVPANVGANAADDGNSDPDEGDEDEAETKALCSCSCSRVKADDPQPVSDELRKALDAILRQQYGGATISADGTVTIPGITETELAKVMEEAVAKLITDGAKVFAADNGEEPTITAENAVDYSKEHAAKLVTEVTETTREHIQTTVTRGIEDGKNVAEIQREIADTTPEIAESRAETIARSETARAMQHGTNMQADELGYNTKNWLLAGGPCPLCEAAAEEKASGVPTDEPFYKAGETITGTDGKSYTVTMDVMVPAELHPKCRCSVTYVKGTPDVNA